jgi:hypothetical protein
MAILFNPKDVMHRITAKFFPAYLPDAKKPYNLRAVHQPKLDIHGIASKAEAYGIPASPLLIEEGMTLGMELVYYLVADGYEINTPVFQLKAGFPGEYDGHETKLPDGVYPHGKITLSARLREYMRRNIEPQFEGIVQNEGYIDTFLDKETNETNTVITNGGGFILRGIGLKIAADTEHAADVGMYYEDAETGNRIFEANKYILTNEPTLLAGINFYGLIPGKSYYIVIRTQSQVNGSGVPLKHVREVKSEFTVAVPVSTQQQEAQS